MSRQRLQVVVTVIVVYVLDGWAVEAHALGLVEPDHGLGQRVIRVADRCRWKRPRRQQRAGQRSGSRCTGCRRHCDGSPRPRSGWRGRGSTTPSPMHPGAARWASARTAPRRPWARISRSTVQRATVMPPSPLSRISNRLLNAAIYHIARRWRAAALTWKAVVPPAG